MARAIGLIPLLVLLSVAACSDEPVTSSRAPAGPQPNYWATFPADAAERATMVRVVDGDTFEAELDGRRVTIRLFGADTPERTQRCYGEASRRLAMLVPPGDTVWLQPGPRNDDGNRLLRYTFTESRVLVDALLVEEGLAEAWRRDGQLRDEIVALEQAARVNDVGCLFGA